MGRKGIHFLKTVSKAEAERIWHDALRLGPLGGEEVSLAEAQGRVLDGDVLVPIDVPPFDRALVDGYAVRAADTFDADEDAPVSLELAARDRTGRRRTHDGSERRHGPRGGHRRRGPPGRQRRADGRAQRGRGDDAAPLQAGRSRRQHPGRRRRHAHGRDRAARRPEAHHP